jgi:hypothetical protein
LPPVFAELARQFEENREGLRAMAELRRHVNELPASQQRRFGKVKVRDAPRYLGLFARQARVRRPERREPVAPEARPRERRATTRRSGSSRASPDSDLPPPPVEDVWRSVVAASARMVQHAERRRAKWAAA